MSRNVSIIQYYGPGRGHSCGYCNSPDSNFSYGMWAYSLTSEDYQNLIDRGWRRSGCYLYKPQLDIQCCPMYTIKCDAVNFKPSQSHKKVIKTFNRYINYGIKPKKYETEDGQMKDVEDKGGCTRMNVEDNNNNNNNNSNSSNNKNNNSNSNNNKNNNSNSNNNIDSSKNENINNNNINNNNNNTNNNSGNSNNNCIENLLKSKEKHLPKPGKGADPEKPAAQKAKVMRMMKKKMKVFEAGDAGSDKVFKAPKTKEKSLEDFLEDFVENPAHKFEIKTVASDSLNIKEREINGDIQKSFKLFQTYQSNIHNDKDNDIGSYNDFLVDSPIFTEEDQQVPQGSFHQQYYIDNKLVCVGVVDVLSKCLSSVYLFYHPDYAFLSLGTYTALRELAYTRQLHKKNSSISSYYMGFYIHSCVKMRYKGQYHPSYLLCPESHTWQPIERSLPLIEENKYTRLADLDTVDAGIVGLNMSEVKIHMRGSEEAKRKMMGGRVGREVEEYAQLVGKKCAYKMLYYIS